MMVRPAASTMRAPLGTGVLVAGPIAAIRSPSITMVPFSITPASSPAMVRMRAPVIATVPVGLAARTVRASEIPVSGGTKLGASSDAGARRNIASVVARYITGPIDQ